MRRAFLLTALAATLAAPASAADKIDLSRPWGNKDGCRNKVSQEVYSEDMFLLTKEAFVMATGSCEIKKTVANKDGSLTLSTMCQTEGEDPVADKLIVKRSTKNKARIALFDADGQAYPQELTQCK